MHSSIISLTIIVNLCLPLVWHFVKAWKGKRHFWSLITGFDSSYADDTNLQFFMLQWQQKDWMEYVAVECEAQCCTWKLFWRQEMSPESHMHQREKERHTFCDQSCSLFCHFCDHLFFVVVNSARSSIVRLFCWLCEEDYKPCRGALGLHSSIILLFLQHWKITIVSFFFTKAFIQLWINFWPLVVPNLSSRWFHKPMFPNCQ